MVGFGPVGIAVNETTNFIYVSNLVSNNVTVIDGNTNAEIIGSPIAVGPAPRGVAVNEITNRIYVANSEGNNLNRIDGDTNTKFPDAFFGGTRPIGVGVTESTNLIYVTNVLNFIVRVIDGVTEGGVGSPITVGSGPEAIAVNQSTNRIYVANQNSNNVSVIDGVSGSPTQNTVIATITVGSGPVAVAVNETTNLIYVANLGGDVTVIDGNTNAEIIGSPITVGTSPRGVAVNEITNRIYVANSSDGTVSVIDGDTNTVIPPTISVGNFPIGIAVNEPTATLYVCNFSDDTVSFIDISVVVPSVTFGNEFQGLAQGAVNITASSILNVINGDQLLFTGDVVKNLSETLPNLLLPRVGVVSFSGESGYGVVIGGNQKGVYGDGNNPSTISEAQEIGILAAVENDAVRMCTQGTCLARVINRTMTELQIGTPLTPDRDETIDTLGAFKEATTGDPILARLLQRVPAATPTDNELRVVAVDVQREGTL